MATNSSGKRIATLAKDPRGETVLLFNSIPNGADEKAAQAEFERLLQQFKYTVLGSFDNTTTAWRQMSWHSQLGALPDPYTSGWFATLSSAYHETKRHGEQNAEHQMKKIHEIRDFLLKVHAVQKEQEAARNAIYEDATTTPARQRP